MQPAPRWHAGTLAWRYGVPALIEDIEGLERQLAGGSRQVTPTIVEQFAKLIAGKLRDTGDGNLRRAYTRLRVDRVEVGPEDIRISRSPTALAEAAAGTRRTWCPG